MQFKSNYPIYLQVSDFICEKVLTQQWVNGDKLPSLKELAVITAVNPNTVVKALTYLQDNNILESRRGIGYFLTDDAARQTLHIKKQQFIEEYLPEVLANMRLLGISMEELEALFERYQQDKVQ